MSSFSELIELVNVANPDAQVQLTEAMVTVKSVAKNEPLVNGRNTTTILTGITSAGVTGDAPVYYDRLYTPTIFAGITVQLELSEQSRTTAQIVEQLNARYGTTFEAAEFVDKDCPADAVTYDLEAKAMAIKFTGVLTIALLASLTMAEVVKIPTLVGFNYPVNAVVGGLRPYKIGDIVFTANESLTLAGNTYRMLPVERPQSLLRADYPVLSALFGEKLRFIDDKPISMLGTTQLGDGSWAGVDPSGNIFTMPEGFGTKWTSKNMSSGMYSTLPFGTKFAKKNLLLLGSNNNGVVTIKKIAPDWSAPVTVFESTNQDALGRMTASSFFVAELGVALVDNWSNGTKKILLITKDEGDTWTRLEIPGDVYANGEEVGVCMGGNGNYIFLSNGKKFWRMMHYQPVAWDSFTEYPLPEPIPDFSGMACDWGGQFIVLHGSKVLLNDTPDWQGIDFRVLDTTGLQGRAINAVWLEGNLHIAYQNYIAHWTFPKNGGGNTEVGANPSPTVLYRNLSLQGDQGIRYVNLQNQGGVSGMMVGQYDEDSRTMSTWWYKEANEKFELPVYPEANPWAKVMADPKPNPAQ